MLARKVVKHLAEYVVQYGYDVGRHYSTVTIHCLSVEGMATEDVEQCSEHIRDSSMRQSSKTKDIVTNSPPDHNAGGWGCISWLNTPWKALQVYITYTTDHHLYDGRIFSKHWILQQFIPPVTLSDVHGDVVALGLKGFFLLLSLLVVRIADKIVGRYSY